MHQTSDNRHQWQTGRRWITGLMVMGSSLFCGLADAETFDWNVDVGGWNFADNWSPIGVPNFGDNALIDNGGTSVVSSAAFTTNLTVGQLLGGRLDVESTLLTDYTALGEMAGGSILVRDGGLLSVNQGNFDVAQGTDAAEVPRLTLQSGGTIDVVMGQTRIGNTGRGVDVTISGSGSSLTTSSAPIIIRGSGTGVFIDQGGRLQTAGGTVSGNSNLEDLVNQVTVARAGSLWRAISDSDPLQFDGGSRLAVLLGGEVRATDFIFETSSNPGSATLKVDGTESGRSSWLRVSEQATLERSSVPGESEFVQIGQVSDGGLFSASDLQITNGTLRINDNGRLSVSNNISLSEGRLLVDGSINSSDLLANAIQGNNSSELTLAHSSEDFVLGPTLTGGLTLVAESTGTTILDKVNTHIEGTIVRGNATLLVEEEGALGSGPVRVLENGTLDLRSFPTAPIGVSQNGKIAGTFSEFAPDPQSIRLESDDTSTPGNKATMAEFQLDATEERTVEFSTSLSSSASNDGARQSNILSIEGSGDDPFVLQLSVDPSLVSEESFVGWLDNGEFVLAIDGNTGNNASLLQQNYVGDFDAFAAEFGMDLSQYIGAWGGDPNSGAIWAVINHNSEFALIPEPSTGLLLLGSAFFFVFQRRRKTLITLP